MGGPTLKSVSKGMLCYSANKKRAQDLYSSFSQLQESLSKIQPELDRLFIRKADIERELVEVNAAILKNESILTSISTGIQRKRKELAVVIAEGKQISKDLKVSSESVDENTKLIANVDAIRFAARDAIR